MGPLLTKPPKGQFEFIREGEKCLTSKNFQRAVEEFTGAIDKNPHYYLSFFFRATALRHLGKLQDALVDLDLCLDLFPSFDTARYEKMEIYKLTDDYDMVVMELSRIPVNRRRVQPTTTTNDGRNDDRYDVALQSFQKEVERAANVKKFFSGKRGTYVVSPVEKRKLKLHWDRKAEWSQRL